MAARLTDAEVRARLKALDEFNVLGSWDMIVPIMGHDGKMTGLHGGFNDWPPMVQDHIMRALVTQCIPSPGFRLKITASGCFQDVPWEPCYLRVVVQEFPPEVRH